MNKILLGILIPFLGTTLGSACVYMIHHKINDTLQRIMIGFAAGVMTAASIWSLLIPSIEQAHSLGELSFIPATLGFWAGILFLLFLDSVIPHMYANSKKPEGLYSNILKTTMLLLAVTIHNIPEGMAVGVVYAGILSGNTNISIASAMALSIGIAIQNFPEGAIVSIPLYTEKMSKKKAFLSGVLSGAVEPIGAILTIVISSFILPLLPYLLSFASGAMMYVVVEELIPEMSHEPHSNIGTLSYAFGFTLMMILDVALA